MKKKILSFMLATTMATTIFTACGNENTLSTTEYLNTPVTSSVPSYQESSNTQTNSSVSKTDLNSQVSKNTLTTPKEKYYEVLNIINNALSNIRLLMMNLNTMFMTHTFKSLNILETI